MITKYFKDLMKLFLQSSGSTNANGFLQAKDLEGNTIYLAPRFSQFPGTITTTVTFFNSSGIQLGTGTSAVSETDFSIENQISSGLTAGTPTITRGLDANGDPYLQFIIAVTNTSATDIVISEIGYAQNIYASSTINTNSTANMILFDHTLLEAPVTVPANNGTAVIVYQLKTIIS